MDVHKSSVLAVFESKQRLEVPLFQRQYVWNEDAHWLPLWEDIERKFTDALDGRADAPNHFLGSLVLDQKQSPTGYVVVRQIIDGQQRLTTLQIFLAAYRDFCTGHQCDEHAAECDKFLFNTGMMADQEVDRFKVWPTELDRSQFRDVIQSRSREEILNRYPLRRRPYARKPDPRPRMVEAYLFLFEKLMTFFLGENGEEPVAAQHRLSDRVDQCLQALRNALMVVLIDLQSDDDPQVIFETLNARGEPLLPADLLRNYIFLRARRDDLVIETAYRKYWARFDDEFWRKEVKQGRLRRPRSDLFMQHFLASRQGRDIPIKHLYTEYRYWIERAKPFPDVESELNALARQRDHFRRIIAPSKDDVVFGLCSFLDAFDIRTAYPLLLALMEADTEDAEWLAISNILESYLLRRAVCNLGTKNYNRIFLSLTRNLRGSGRGAARLRELLLQQTGDSGVWPDDASFREAWLRKPLYGPLNNPKLVHLYGRLNPTFMSSKSEKLFFAKQPTVEHIMPQGWISNWPLPDGSPGMTMVELWGASEADPRAVATRDRERAIQTLGNLTILSDALNTAQSHYSWDKKRPELMKHSLLPINQTLVESSKTPTWDEATILNRGQQLFDRALTIWTR
jgi:uncharacterized protein with ParB-like and HNH nuclease domain